MLLSLLFTGCATPGKPGVTTTVSSLPSEALTLFRNGASDYAIVYPADAPGYVINAASQIQSEFEKATGVTLPIDDDYLKKDAVRSGEEQNAPKILVGYTNFAESAEVFAGLRYYDYEVRSQGNKLVIAGFGEEELLDAAQWLSENVFAGFDKTGTLYFNEGVKFEYENYSIESFTVAGRELAEFSFVYSDPAHLAYCVNMRNLLARRYGYYLPVLADTAARATDKEILVGDTNRAASAETDAPTYLHYYIGEKDGNLVIKAGGEHSIAWVAENFLSSFELKYKKIAVADGAEYQKNLYTDPYGNNVPPTDSDVRVMSANVLAEWENYGGAAIPVSRRSEIFFSSLDYYKPTVVGLQEFSPKWFEVFETYADKDKWSIISATNVNNKKEKYLTAILYRKDLLEVVGTPGFQYYSEYNNGRCRVMSYTVFKVKATGKQFIFFNTHWDGAGENGYVMTQCSEAIAKIRALQAANPGLPVFCTADWNSNEWTTAFKTFTAELSLQNAKTSALTKLNQIGSWHELGKSTPSSGSADHIFATQNATAVRFETLITNEQIWASDHSWLVADMRW